MIETPFPGETAKRLHSVEAEMAMLGAMLISEKACEQCLLQVDESDLYRPAHRLIFRSMRDLKRRGMEIDQVTLETDLTAKGDLANIGGPDYLLEVAMYMPSPSGAQSYAETVLEASRLRRLEMLGRNLIGKVHSPEDGTAADIASWASLEALNVGGSAAGVKSMADIDENGGDLGLSTGVKEIDSRMETAGAPLGQMCVIVAEEKHGKSTELVGRALWDAWQLRGCLYVTLADLNDRRLKRKFLRGRSGYSELRTAQDADAKLPEHEQGWVSQFAAEKRDLEQSVALEILDRTRLGGDDVDQILAAIETYRQRRSRMKIPLQVVYIDYAQKLTSKKFRASDSVAMYAYCSKAISSYAESTGLVIWVGSQITQGNLKMGTRMMTKGGRCWLEDCGMAWLIEKLDDEQRKERGCDSILTMTHSRFKGAGTVVDMRFDRVHDLLVPL